MTSRSIHPLSSPNHSPDSNVAPRTLVVGATGLVGRACARAWLLDERRPQVIALVRRPPSPPLDVDEEAARRLRVAVIDFAALEQHRDLLEADHVVCALGTTRKQAGSKEAFRAVDYDLALRVATMARAQGARHLLLVSAVGADARSRVFYNRVKGELEEAVGRLGYPSLTIARPSVLQGPRAEHRPGEALAQRLGVILPSAYRPVHASQVAAALHDAARRDLPGVRVIENRELLSFARR
jgi:uncharacterized protein YbjT (DUF2867 family)